MWQVKRSDVKTWWQTKTEASLIPVVSFTVTTSFSFDVQTFSWNVRHEKSLCRCSWICIWLILKAHFVKHTCCTNMKFAWWLPVCRTQTHCFDRIVVHFLNRSIMKANGRIQCLCVYKLFFWVKLLALCECSFFQSEKVFSS